eukprot:Hpha_TRINITY_DN16205_c0_g2::TRINITY_DN16205_c0_g2_i1::g.14228::m.14228
MRRGRAVWRHLLLCPWKRSATTLASEVREGEAVELRVIVTRKGGLVDAITPPAPIVRGTVVCRSRGEVTIRLSHTQTRERKLTGFTLDGPHLRPDGCRYFVERYTVECDEGSEERGLDNQTMPRAALGVREATTGAGGAVQAASEVEVEGGEDKMPEASQPVQVGGDRPAIGAYSPVAGVGALHGAVPGGSDLKCGRGKGGAERGTSGARSAPLPGQWAYAHSASPWTVSGTVTSIDREGPIMSTAGQLRWVDWYTLLGGRRVRKSIFDERIGHICQVGERAVFRLRKGKSTVDVMGPVLCSGEEELQGKVVCVRRVTSPTGKGMTEAYEIEVRPGVTRSCARFTDIWSEPLCEEGASVVVRVRNDEHRALTFLVEVLRISDPDARCFEPTPEYEDAPPAPE